MSTLLVTVGGSPEPIVTAIRSLRPAKVVYLVSAASRVCVEGDPPGSGHYTDRGKRDTIPRRLGRSGEHDDIDVLAEIDDFAAVYAQVAGRLVVEIEQAGRDAVAVDYTGGTKSMSVGAVLAALDHGVRVYLTTARRTNLQRVERGQVARRADPARVHEQRLFSRVLPELAARFEYAAACQEIAALLRDERLDPAAQERLQTLYEYFAALDAWDRFDHDGADELAGQVGRLLGPRRGDLQRILRAGRALESDEPPDPQTPGSYSPVRDLLRNAERRAAAERYDDAVGRLYRALEALAQFRLWFAHGLRTSRIPSETLLPLLPEDRRARWQQHAGPDGSLTVSLTYAYELLADLDDQVGRAFTDRRGAIIDALKLRNHSLLAHGFRPVTSEDYRRLAEVVGGFVEQTLDQLDPKGLDQLPNQLPAVDG